MGDNGAVLHSCRMGDDGLCRMRDDGLCRMGDDGLCRMGDDRVGATLRKGDAGSGRMGDDFGDIAGCTICKEDNLGA